LNQWTKMSASNQFFYVHGTILEGCSQLEYEDKLISRNWLDFLDCMQVTGRDPKKHTLVSKGIQNVLKEVKELSGSTSESKINELESFIGSSASEQIVILPANLSNTKGSGKQLKGEKKKLWSNKPRGWDFVKLVDNKLTMIAVIVPQNSLKLR